MSTDDRTTETVTKTIICPLETSARKNERLRAVIDEWQEMAGWLAARMPSIDADHWRTQDSTIRHVVENEYPDCFLLAHVRDQAAYKVGEAFGSWDSNGRQGASPMGEFGDADYARFSHDAVAVAENDRGFGLKIGLHPYDHEWWHIGGGAYQYEYLAGVVDGDRSSGSAELHLDSDGAVTAHLAVSTDVEVIDPDEVIRWVGVCLGESTLYSAVALTADEQIDTVNLAPGDEFRHYRERFKRKRANLMEDGALRELVSLRDEHRRFTDYITHRAAREIVDFASDHSPCGIRLEDLTGLREEAPDPIHDFPYAEIQEKVSYKATEAGLPVEFVSPAGSKTTCRKCGATDGAFRRGSSFECECGYTVHSFVNGAANIGQGED